MEKIDVIATSCGRWPLLERSIESLLTVNTHPIGNLLIHEDGLGDNEKEFHDVVDKYNPAWVSHTHQREGQIVALDTLMRNVQSEFFLSIENDWVCVRDDFAQKAIDLMNNDPRIHCVWLRGADLVACNGHPMINRGEYYELRTDWMWKGMSFGASIKRRSHYQMLGSYGAHTKYDFKSPWTSEWTIGEIYFQKGFIAVSLPDTHFVHIGTETTPKP